MDLSRPKARFHKLSLNTSIESIVDLFNHDLHLPSLSSAVFSRPLANRVEILERVQTILKIPNGIWLD